MRKRSQPFGVCMQKAVAPFSLELVHINTPYSLCRAMFPWSTTTFMHIVEFMPGVVRPLPTAVWSFYDNKLLLRPPYWLVSHRPGLASFTETVGHDIRMIGLRTSDATKRDAAVPAERLISAGHSINMQIAICVHPRTGPIGSKIPH